MHTSQPADTASSAPQRVESSTAGADDTTAPRLSKIRGTKVGRWHLRYFRTYAPDGWAFEEGGDQRRSVAVFGLSRCYEHNIFQGWRLIVGPHVFNLLA